MDMFEAEIIKAIKKETKLGEVILTKPKTDFGDFAFPCFVIAKELKKNPNDIAKELSAKIKPSKLISKVQALGPYVNFFVNTQETAGIVLKKIVEEGDKYGSSNLGKGKKSLIEHTSINPNASPHVGRARNAIIGDSIVRIIRFQGYNTEVHYFVNDVGKQIAMLLLGAKGKEVTFDGLLDMYIDINEKAKTDPSIEKEVFEILNKLESGDTDTKKRFKEIVDICIKGQSKILGDLGIEYDKYDYESDYLWNKRTDEVIKALQKKGKLEEDAEGRFALNQEEYKLPMKAPYLVLSRADKTSLYPLRDLAYTIDKVSKKFDKNVIVLGEDQKLYFQQLSAALDLLGYPAPEVVHYSFVLLSDGKMSTRKGTVVLLEEFMKEAFLKAKEEISKREKLSAKELDERARMIANGAIKYSILRVSSDKNVTFEWDTALGFEGDTGPYLQYAYARICSIIRKYGKKIDTSADTSLLKEAEEIEVIKYLNEFPNIIEKTTKSLKPHLIANYVYELSQKFSEFYHKCPVLKAEDDNLMGARLVLVDCVRQVLKNGLGLLGIDILERM